MSKENLNVTVSFDDMAEIMWQYNCIQLLFLQYISFLNHTSLIPFHFYSPLKYLGNNKGDKFNWRNLFTFFSRYIDDIIIDKFWYIGKPSCPPLFSKWIITIIFTIFKTIHSFLGLKQSQEHIGTGILQLLTMFKNSNGEK